MSCKHPSLFQNMCVVCGMKVGQNGHTNAKTEGVGGAAAYKTTLNISGGKVLQLSVDEVAAVSASKLSNLRNSKRLALVLDLDHTLLHAVQVEGQTPSRTSATARTIAGTKGMGSGDGPDDNVVHHLPIEEIDRLTVKHLVMKKRPFLDEFLEKASEFCQMTVYTAGTRRYAEAVARVIDPSRRYFGDRIVSRDDVAGIRADGNDKSLERIYPGDASMAVIIDDREDVWRGAQSAQLLLVRPFQHFDPRPSEAAAAAAAAAGVTVIGDNAASPLPDALGTVSRGVAVPPPSAGNKQPAEIISPIITMCASPSGEPAGRIVRVAPLYSFEHSSGDDQLKRCLQVLRQIHAQYYDGGGGAPPGESGVVESKDGTNSGSSNSNSKHRTAVANGSSHAGIAKKKKSVAVILGDLKRQVLAGCTITFSGLIPTNEENPRNHPLWRLAESLGAQVSQDVVPRTTHLISLHTQTQKVAAVLQHRASQVWVLHPDWLVYCRWSLSRVQESTFMLAQLAPGQALPCPVMDYSPLQSPFPAPVAALLAVPGPSASVAAPRPQPPVTAVASGSGAPRGDAGGSASGAEGAEKHLKRGRDEGVDAKEDLGPGSLDVLNTLKRLRAAGPAPSAADAGTTTGLTIAKPPSIPSRTGGAVAASAVARDESARRSDLFRPVGEQQGAGGAGGGADAGISQPAPSLSSSSSRGSSSSSGSSAAESGQAPRIGVIKKKVNALALERDSSGEDTSPVVRRDTGRAVAYSGGRTSSTASNTNLRRPVFAPRTEAAQSKDTVPCGRYSPDKVRVAGPADLDLTTYRLDPADAAQCEVSYFADPLPDADVAKGDGAGSSASDGRISNGSTDGGGEISDGVIRAARLKQLARRGSAGSVDSGIGEGDSQRSSSSDSESGVNSLLGDGDGDYSLYRDEDDVYGGGGGDADQEDGEDSTCDEGLLCCNDDQDSTCSATPLEDGDSWGRRNARRKRGARHTAAAFGYEEVIGDASGSVDPTARDAVSGGSLRSAAASSSSDDDGSDFEVMMMRRRRLADAAAVAAEGGPIIAVGLVQPPWIAPAAYGGTSLPDEDELCSDG